MRYKQLHSRGYGFVHLAGPPLPCRYLCLGPIARLERLHLPSSLWAPLGGRWGHSPLSNKGSCRESWSLPSTQANMHTQQRKAMHNALVTAGQAHILKVSLPQNLQ